MTIILKDLFLVGTLICVFLLQHQSQNKQETSQRHFLTLQPYGSSVLPPLEGPSDRGRIPTARFNSRQKISHPFFSKMNPQGQTSATFCNKKSLLFPFTFHQNLERLSMYVEFPRLFIQKRKALSSLEIWVSSAKVSRKDICFAWVDNPFLHANKSYVLHH